MTALRTIIHRALRIVKVGGVRGRLFVDSQFDPDGSPLTILDVFNTIHQHQLSQEVQATGTSYAGGLHWVSGLYYFNEQAHEEQPVNIALELFRGAANFDPQADGASPSVGHRRAIPVLNARTAHTSKHNLFASTQRHHTQRLH